MTYARVLSFSPELAIGTKGHHVDLSLHAGADFAYGLNFEPMESALIMVRMLRMTFLCCLPVRSAISRLIIVSTAPGSTMGSTISRFAAGLAEEEIFILSGFLGRLCRVRTDRMTDR